MKTKTHILLFTLTVLLLSSCIIAINETGYRHLKSEYKKHFYEFDINNFDKLIDNSDSTTIRIEEVTVENVKSILNKHKYTCIELWSPYCHAEVCQSLTYYDKLCNNYKNKDFSLMKISRTYDYEYITKIIQRSDYKEQMYVIKYQDKYGKYIDRTHDRFSKDISGKDLKIRKSYFYFKDTTFIHADDFLKENILDSLMAIYD